MATGSGSLRSRLARAGLRRRVPPSEVAVCGSWRASDQKSEGIGSIPIDCTNEG